MSRILEILSKLASDLDELEALEYADQVDDISSIMTGTDVASGQHMPAGDTQWSLPSVGVNMSKDAMGLNDIPIGDAPYANREGIPEDDMDTQLLGGEEEGVAMPPINDKYEMNLEMDDHLDSLEAFLFDNDLRKYAKRVFELRSFAQDQRQALVQAFTKLVDKVDTQQGVNDQAKDAFRSAMHSYIWKTNDDEGRIEEHIKRLMFTHIFTGDNEMSGRVYNVHYSSIVRDVAQKAFAFGQMRGPSVDSGASRKEQLFHILVHRYHIPHAWLTDYTRYNQHGKAPNTIPEMWATVQNTPGNEIPDNHSARWGELMVEWYDNYAEGGKPPGQGRGSGDDDRPSASGPRGESGRPDPGTSGETVYAGLKPLQQAMGTPNPPDGLWSSSSQPWADFIDQKAVPYLDSKGANADADAMKTDWGSVADSLGQTADWDGMLNFYNTVMAAQPGDPQEPEPAQPGEPQEPGDDEGDGQADQSPVTASVNDVKRALLFLSQNKQDHEVEGAGKEAVKSLGGGYSMRRTNRYLRHLDKLIEGDGTPYDKVAQYLIENYSDEMNSTLAEAKAFHDEHEADQGEWGEKHQFEHLISKVYELLQMVWGDLNAEEGTGQGRRRDRRSERRQRRQDQRGRRRLDRQ